MVEISYTSVEPFAEGAELGEAGAYERVIGILRGWLDPEDAGNAGIVNIDKAPRDANGRVAYEADFFILRPADPAKRNGKVLYDVVNRGMKLALTWLNDAPETLPVCNNDPKDLADAGNRFLFRDGWTIAWSGWEAILAPLPNLTGIRLPTATDGGNTIVKRIREEHVAGQLPGGVDLLNFPLTYEHVGDDQAQASLTVRQRQSDPRVALGKESWAYSGPRSVKLLPDGTEFERNAIYDFWYPARDPKVLGIGFAAVRDFLSWLRFDSGQQVQSLIGLGISQSGRFAREFLSLGMNRDLQGRALFDGLLIHIAGAGRTFANFEFGQPSRTRTQHRDHNVPEQWFPFGFAMTSDPLTGEQGVLTEEPAAGLKIMSVNSSTEYWSKGASLTHTDPAGTSDADLPENVRCYLIAGTQHGAISSQQQGRGPCACHANTQEVAPALRALLTALDEWTSNGRPPPDSQVPMIAAGSLVDASSLAFPNMPDLAAPAAANAILAPADWIDPPQHRGESPYRVLVCQVDGQGNEVAGIRLPDVAVPLGTLTGWSYHDTPETCRELCNLQGSFVPFAKTRSERIAVDDERLSLEELYTDAATYQRQVSSAVTALIAKRLLLPEDGRIYEERAASVDWS